MTVSPAGSLSTPVAPAYELSSTPLVSDPGLNAADSPGGGGALALEALLNTEQAVSASRATDITLHTNVIRTSAGSIAAAYSTLEKNTADIATLINPDDAAGAAAIQTWQNDLTTWRNDVSSGASQQTIQDDVMTLQGDVNIISQYKGKIPAAIEQLQTDINSGASKQTVQADIDNVSTLIAQYNADVAGIALALGTISEASPLLAASTGALKRFDPATSPPQRFIAQTQARLVQTSNELSAALEATGIQSVEDARQKLAGQDAKLRQKLETIKTAAQGISALLGSGTSSATLPVSTLGTGSNPAGGSGRLIIPV